jgi:hypothetical protein
MDILNYVYYIVVFSDIHQYEMKILYGNGYSDDDHSDMIKYVHYSNTQTYFFQNKMPHHYDGLFEFNIMASFSDTPTMRKMILRDAMSTTTTTTTTKMNDVGTKTLSLSIPDIEDLFSPNNKDIPPCIRRLTQRKWLKYHDKINMVKFLVDAGKPMDAIVDIICKGEYNTEQNRKEIEGIYKSTFTKGKRDRTGRFSYDCWKIINIKEEEDHYLRCPYEEMENGKNRRRDHTFDEKVLFTKECAKHANITTHWIQHPIDFYISIQ